MPVQLAGHAGKEPILRFTPAVSFAQRHCCILVAESVATVTTTLDNLSILWGSKTSKSLFPTCKCQNCTDRSELNTI
jgi:hypothetical protein